MCRLVAWGTHTACSELPCCPSRLQLLSVNQLRLKLMACKIRSLQGMLTIQAGIQLV